ncbi:MAG: hypothetical protein AAFO94_04270 [Bacteroidota bacterium]
MTNSLHLIRLKCYGLLCCMALALSAYAQTTVTEGEILRDVNADVIQRNEAIVRQIGDQNTSVVLLQSGSDAANYARVVQRGDLNRAQLVVAGNNNFTKVRQIGNSNVYELQLVGNDNNIIVLQAGDGNTIQQELNQSDLNNIRIVQRGNNNTVIHEQQGNAPDPNIRIRQIGNDLQMIIRN